MRAMLVSVMIFGSLPVILFLPFFGILVFSWVSYMNPHKLAYWSFIADMPVAALVAGTTLLAYLFSTEPKRLPPYSVVVVWVLFILWMNVTTAFALTDDLAMQGWDRTMKIQLMALVTLAFLTVRQRLDLLVWVIVVSIGFYGVKGGLFTLRTGGQFLLKGPTESFIAGNNEVAFAILLVIPLMRYLQLIEPRAWVRHGLTVAMGLCTVAVLGSYSRGAFLAAAAIGIFLWLKSPRRLVLGLGIVAVAAGGLAFMPQQWFDRMETIQNYQEDGSAMGRINAWWYAYNLANDRPLVGAGFKGFTPELFRRYAPHPNDYHDSHSIYFEVLGEHGYVGLFLFLTLALLTWRNLSRVQRRAKGREDLRWARQLAAMLQVSLVGYGVGGAFLGLGYFDLLYHFIGLSLAVRVLTDRRIDNDEDVETRTLWSALPPPNRYPAPVSAQSRHGGVP